MKFLVLFLCFLLSTCSKENNVRGGYLTECDVQKVKIGLKKEDVFNEIGTPFMQMKDNSVLYICREEMRVPFCDSKIVKEINLKIEFDKNGKVKSFEKIILSPVGIKFDKDCTDVNSSSKIKSM